MFRLLTDFNAINNDIVTGLVENAEGPRPVGKGDRVLLHDDGEHEAWGTVIRTTKGLIGAKVDWSTWAEAGTYREQQRNGWLIALNWNVPAIKSTVGGGSVRMPPRRSLVGRR